MRYRPAFSRVTRAPRLVRSEIVAPGPTVAVSVWIRGAGGGGGGGWGGGPPPVVNLRSLVHARTGEVEVVHDRLVPDLDRVSAGGNVGDVGAVLVFQRDRPRIADGGDQLGLSEGDCGRCECRQPCEGGENEKSFSVSHAPSTVMTRSAVLDSRHETTQERQG